MQDEDAGADAARSDDARGSDARSDAARSEEVRGSDARSDDARGSDARSDAARSDDARGSDARSDDDRGTSGEDGSGVAVADGVVTLSASSVEQYRRFTTYNSPYVAHDAGRAVDLYPVEGSAPSPVAGEVIATETVRAPSKPYAPDEDHLVVVDCGPVVARIMHVDPRVEVGATVEVGDDLGDLVRAGFFARWVPNHLHVGFRRHDQNHLRASGSLPLALDVDPTPLAWDGTGTVVDVDDTYATLDAPTLPPVEAASDDAFYGLAAGVDDRHGDRTQVVLDGGLQHYDAGGVHADAAGSVHLLGERVGTAAHAPGGTNPVTWRALSVRANGDRVHGLSLYCGQRGDYAIKLVGENLDLAVGDDVTVTLDAGAP